MIDQIQHRGWVKIETASDLITAQLLKGMLEEQNILAVMQPGSGKLRGSQDEPIDVFVAPKDENKARELIDSYFDEGFTDEEVK